MWLSIEKGGDAVALTERINRRQAEKEELEEQLAIEQNKRVILSEAQILAFLNYVCEMPGDDTAKRRAIINIFVHSVYLYDDHLTLIINASNKPVTIDDIPLDDIEAAFNGEKSAMEQCSNTSDIVPPLPSHHIFMWCGGILCGNRDRNRPSLAPAKGTYNAKVAKRRTKRSFGFRHLHQKQKIRNYCQSAIASDFLFIYDTQFRY